jgi:chaperonin cofactor prefoldin
MTDDLSRLRAELAHERETNEKLATSNVKLRAQAEELRSRLQTVADELCDDGPFPVIGVEELIDHIEKDAHKFRVRVCNLERNNDALTKNNLRLSKMVRDALGAARKEGDLDRVRAVLEETGS